MEVYNSHDASGSLRISQEVIEKIARHAALEVEGVKRVTPVGGAGGQGFLDKLTQPRAVTVEMNNAVADIEVPLTVAYGVKIPEISEKVQESVKDAVQSMTSISVARVDVVITGVEQDAPAVDEEV